MFGISCRIVLHTKNGKSIKKTLLKIREYFLKKISRIKFEWRKAIIIIFIWSRYIKMYPHNNNNTIYCYDLTNNFLKINNYKLQNSVMKQAKY